MDKKIDDIFTGFCKENKHYTNLEYFCKTHNKLICPSCIAKIKGKGYGEHNNCDVCFINDIIKEKQNLLNTNIKYLKEISNTIEKSFNELKDILEKINKNRKELKSTIKKIFTKIRDVINNKEEKLLNEVDQKYDELVFKEELAKKFQNMPNIIKESLEKFRSVDNKWNDEEEIKPLINDCINLENIVKEIEEINENIQKCKKNDDLEIGFRSKDEEVNIITEKIENLGSIFIAHNNENLEEKK